MLDKIAADIRKVLETKSFSGSLKFDCGADGVIVLADGQIAAFGARDQMLERLASRKPPPGNQPPAMARPPQAQTPQAHVQPQAQQPQAAPPQAGPGRQPATPPAPEAGR